MVDTGASHVSVIQALATQAGLPAAQNITLYTANGQRPGQLFRGVPVRVGHLVLNDASVTVGLNSGYSPTKPKWAKPSCTTLTWKSAATRWCCASALDARQALTLLAPSRRAHSA